MYVKLCVVKHEYYVLRVVVLFIMKICNSVHVKAIVARHQRATVNAAVVDSTSLVGMKYLVFLFPRCRNAVKRGIEFHHSTRNDNL